MPPEYWVEAFNTVVFLINRLPTKVLDYLSPYEKLYKHSPDYTILRTFGCACFPYLRPYNRNKLQFRSKQCIFLGYSLNHQGYRCLDLDTGRVYLSRHVVFNEKSFPYQSLTEHASLPSQESSHVLIPHTMTPSLSATPPSISLPNDSSPPIVAASHGSPLGDHSLPPISPQISDASNVSPSLHPPNPPPLPTHPMTTRSKAGIKVPNHKYALTVVSVQEQVEPTCFSQAVKQPEWRSAMGTEFNALQKCGTWSLVEYFPSMNVLSNKWVYKIKKKSDGSIERYKARLVANGFHQQEGLDYTETFSPVVKHTTIRAVLALALHQSWPLRQLDVQNAFLHGHLTEEVYMRQPRGFEDPMFPNHVCKLHRSLYGLKQAPRAWFQRFSDYLEDLGFVGSRADYPLFTYHHNSITILLLIYVDDILLTGNSASHLLKLIADLGRFFSMKDLGRLHYFLGLEAIFTAQGLSLTQTKYALDLLQRTNMSHAKPCSSPAASGKKLAMFDGDPLPDPTEYRSVVGALQYLTLTRPDLSFAVNQACQYMHCPTTTHWTAVKRILRYIKGTFDHGIFFQPGSLCLEAFSDADYAGSPDDRRSTGGYCVYLGANLISWSAKKQSTVSRSSTESEYRQLAHMATEISWLRHLMKDLRIFLPTPIIWCDNISSISLASNPVMHARTKHLEVDYHYVWEKVVRKELDIRYICSDDQVADVFTKGLSTPRFEKLKAKLMVRQRPIIL